LDRCSLENIAMVFITIRAGNAKRKWVNRDTTK